jgi:hypothetical protein
MLETTIPTPKASTMSEWRRRVKGGYRPPPAPTGTVIHAYENNDYSALLRALKNKTLYFDGHWVWLGQIRDDGSEWVYLRAKAVRVWRLVSEAFIGAPLDSRDKIWSTCSHKGCVNPEHLEIRIYSR